MVRDFRFAKSAAYRSLYKTAAWKRTSLPNAGRRQFGVDCDLAVRTA